MASIPSSGSLVATHDYYRRRLGSTSSSSSCGSVDYSSGEVITHHPGLPKSDPGHWWASFFFGKPAHPVMTTVSESPEKWTAKAKFVCLYVDFQGFLNPSHTPYN